MPILAKISRSEFILPNLGSLIMGLAWGASPPLGVFEGVVLLVFSFAIINLSSAIGAQANTLSDYELDLKDDRKRDLVEAMKSYGRGRLKKVLAGEFVLCLLLVSVFAFVEDNLVLLPLWIIGISLGMMYSFKPLRLKSRSWLAPVSLMLVLAVFPVLFAYFSFTFEINLFFLLALVGLSFTVYGVIVPTEIRDYFGDKAMNIKTMSVRLGLSQSILLGIVLLCAGGTLTGTALFLQWNFNQSLLWLTPVILVIPFSLWYVMTKFSKLYILSKEYERADQKGEKLENKIVSFSSDNPKWIMIVTQTLSFLSVLLLVSKFFL